LQRHLHDVTGPARHKRAVMHRSSFPGALMWLELHGNAPEVVESWRALQAETSVQFPEGAPLTDAPAATRRRRRRRRRGYRGTAQTGS